MTPSEPSPIEAVVTSVFSLDVDDLETWQPSGPAWEVVLQLGIGSRDSDGADIFQVSVVSPAWLEAEAHPALGQVEVLDVRHHLVTPVWDWPRIRGYLWRRVEECTGATWDEVALRLSRFAHWEYEDYRPHPSDP